MTGSDITLFQLGQRNAYVSGQRSGTYSVDGDRIRLTFDDLGQSYLMRWTLYRGRLRFEAGAKAGGELGLLVKPFERVA